MLKRVSESDSEFQNVLVANGLIFIRDFLTPAEAHAVVQSIPETADFKFGRGRNSTRRWGKKKPYPGSFISEAPPEYLQKLALKVSGVGASRGIPESISINEYLPGNSIAPHVDNDASGDVISILSLLSEAEIRIGLDKITYRISLPIGSLLQLTGNVRWKWTHSIPPVTDKRYSIVFRC